MLVETDDLYNVVHEQYATDRFTYGSTIVRASSEEDAMKKLNDYLSTKPHGPYTALPCNNIRFVSKLKVLV